MEIGDRIKRERVAAGLTQVRLAERVGVDKSAVAQWESPASRKGISTENLLKVAAALAIPVGRLTGEASDDRLETAIPEEIELVRLWRLLNSVQKASHLQLFRTSAGVVKQSEAESHPLHGKRITG